MTFRKLFSFKGRARRVEFLLVMLGIAVAIAVMLMIAIASNFRLIPSPIGLGIVIAIMWVYLAAMTRRLHDHNKSAWYIFLYLGVPSVLQMFKHDSDGSFRIMLFSGGLNSFLDIVCFAISIWMSVELFALRGSTSGNQYGPAQSVNVPG